MTDLITLDMYKTAKGITKTDKDEILSILITNASAIIQSYIGRKLINDGEPIEEVISLDYDTQTIFLNQFPVSNVTIEAIDPWYYDSTVHFPIAPSEFRVVEADGKILRLGKYPWPQGPGAIVVTYNAGSDISDGVPAELTQATIDLVAYYFQEEYKDKSMRGATMNNFVSASEKSNNFPPHIQRVLDLYT